MSATAETPFDRDEDWDSDVHKGGYLVSGSDAVAALLEAGRIEAATFWGKPVPPTLLRFDVACCEVLPD